jgi:lipopolysaccharide transport system permease protein
MQPFEAPRMALPEGTLDLPSPPLPRAREGRDEADGRRVTRIRPPAVSPRSLRDGVATLWAYRDLVHTLTAHRVKVRYKQSVLGVAWAILQPLSLMAIYTVVFSVFARIPSDGIPYAVFAYTALLPWTFFSTALTNATAGLTSHTQLVTKVYFPREILPLSYVLAALFDFVIATSVLGGLLAWYGVPVTPTMLWMVPLLAVLLIFVTGLALLLSALQVVFRDVGVAMPLLLQLWMFASPVIYPVSAVPGHLRGVYMLNPMVGLIDGFRRAVLEGAAPDARSLGTALGVSLLLLVAGYAFFKHRESTLADVI